MSRQEACPRGWAELSDEDYDRAWDLVDRTLGFRPAVDPSGWPSFDEPEGSMTWHLRTQIGEMPGESTKRAVRRASRALLRGLRATTPNGQVTYALDWQHPGYRVDPHRTRAARRIEAWPIPPVPYGDYFLFLATDLRSGWITHPWEQTVCVYGALLPELRPFIESWGWVLRRRDGRPVST